MAFLLSVLATFLNPRGLEQPLTFFRSAGSSALWEVRDEWTHFDPTGGTAYGPAVSPLALFTADLEFLCQTVLVLGVYGYLLVDAAVASRSTEPSRGRVATA